MTRPIQQAARASQNLQSRVAQLSNALNKSKSSVANASASNRILAERYRELGQRIGVTDEKLKTSIKLFRALPAPIRLAAYSLEGYAKALYNTVAKNTLVRITTKALTTTFKTLYTVTWNLTYYLKRAAKALWDFSRASKLIKFIATPFKLAAHNAKIFGQNMLIAAKSTFLYKAMSAVVKTVAKDIKWAAIAQKTFIKDIPYLVKGTRAWQTYQYAIAKAKQEIGKAYLAFNLWKNASPTVDKVKQKFEGLGRSISKIFSPLTRSIQGFKQLGNTASTTGNKGRATFNQLAEANARLNREVSKLNQQLAKANGRLGSMKSNLGSLNTMGAAFGTAYAAQAAYHSGSQLVENTVGRAMEQQYSQASVGILAGAEKGAKFWRQIQEYASTTAYSAEEWARNMRAAISKSKSVEDLKKYQTVIEQLATLDPAQGLEGAALAVRELNSGDIVSLVERFELPRSAVKSIKDIKDPIKQVEALSKLIGEQTGYTVENIQKMKELPLMQWQKMTNSIKTAMGYIGSGALEKIAPLMEKFNKAWDSGKFEPFIKKATEVFGNIAAQAINFVTNLGSNVDSIKAKWQPFIDLFNNIKNSIAQAWPTISEIINNMGIIFNNVASDINSVWPAVNTVFQTTLNLVKNFSGWIANNWSTIAPIIAGIATLFLSYRTIVPVITAVTAVLKAFREGTLLARIAFAALNLVMRMNPIGLVISLLIGIGMALYVAYQKNETFRNAVQKAWNWLKGAGAAAINAGKAAIDGLASALKSAWEWVGNLWDKFTGFVNKVKNTKINWGGILPGGKPFIEIGGGKSKGKGHHGGLNYVPYDGYLARLHKGERVLTKDENKEYSQANAASGVLITGNTFIVRQDSDIDAIADALFQRLYEAKTAVG
jgi:phage-related protein